MDPLLLFFLVTVVLCLLRARDLPTIDVGEASIGLPDVGLLVLALLAALRLQAERRSLRLRGFSPPHSLSPG